MMLSRPCAEACEIFAAVADPLHRAAEASRRPQHQHPFGIEHVLHPEAAADIGNADAQFDLATGKHLFTIEHEVRSATHPMFMRPMVNRNPAQTNRNYAHGHDQWLWAMGPDQYDLR